MGLELEWKFAATEAALAQVQSETPGDWRRIGMESLYYDTPDRAFSARRWTLRLRRENGEAVVCLKTPAADGRGRGEWEVRAESPVEAVPRLLAAGAPAELADLLDGRPPEVVCGARFTRRALTVALPGAEAELALDQGVLLAGEREAPLCELEVEHKSGDSAASETYAAALAARLGLVPEPRSKFQRALALRTD